ncbi:MAG: phenylalanine--tRNA ligase subunit beta [Catonella sp.]|nr:phenylalanine--tRNA ligase subunit beta [Catonella sp.]MDY6356678.1 phenylalanine--tRNA ligase subunit beta [Catonella sp.]
MNTPLSWIKALVPGLDVNSKEYADAMTLSGTKVETVTDFDRDLDKIIVGRVNKIDKHPDADHLVICQVQVDEDGNEIQIVTGAPNVFEGAVVPVVLDGGRVAGGHDGTRTEGGIKIKKGKLRGVESNGMMCSIEELGSSREFYPEAPENGLYIFNNNPGYENLKIGSDAIEALGLHDSIIEYEVTSNRVDCFGVIGIAREAAATFNRKLVIPEIKKTGNSEKASDYISVEVKANDLCSRYIARVVKNIKIGPSPVWMQRRLGAMGIRPINNIVDITNYVMEEFGQPMHAYDLDKLEGRKIIVDRASKGEKFMTLDGALHELDDSILMINDAVKPVGIAGIMGGENSKIENNVKTMLFEAACFDGTNIRLSGKKLGMRTEAAGKFEKGLDPNTTAVAMDRACQLIEELGAGEVVGGAVDIYPVVKEPEEVAWDLDACNKLLGTSITMEEAEDYLGRLDLPLSADKKKLIVPTWRQDIHRNCDVAEELVRFAGYDKIPATLPSIGSGAGGQEAHMDVADAARTIAVSYGFSEEQTYSFESPKVFDKLRLDENDPARTCIKIMNPLGEDFSIMRTSILNGLLTSLATNFKRKNKGVKLFEVSNIYIPKVLPLTEYPDERPQFTLGMYESGDFFDMKGIIESFFAKLGMKEKPSYDGEAKRNFLHPGRQAEIIYKGNVVGYLGEVHPLVTDAYGISTRVIVGNIDLKAVYEFVDFSVKYTGIANFPAVSRDISLIMDKTLSAADIEAVIVKKGGKDLENVELFDVYEGERIEKDKKSMAYSLTFRNKEKTLSDAEVNSDMDKIIKGLSDIGASLRS